MAYRDHLQHLVGPWKGNSKLWLMPGQPAQDSVWAAELAHIVQGQFMTLNYTWAYEGKPQEGVVTFGLDESDEAAGAVWLDSWHMANKIMVCRRSWSEAGAVILRGSFAAPPGPDWGWRIEVYPGNADSFVLKMFNITPEGEEALAVLTEFSR